MNLIDAHTDAIQYQYFNDDFRACRQNLVELYRLIKRDPASLNSVSRYGTLGNSMFYFLKLKISDDVDVLQTVTSIGYLATSLKIRNSPNQSLKHFYRNRIKLMRFGENFFKYTVSSALKILENNRYDFDEPELKMFRVMWSMELSDFHMHPEIYLPEDDPDPDADIQEEEFYINRKEQLEGLVEKKYFEDEDLNRIVKSGTENHNAVFSYLENRILKEGDVDF